MDLGNIVYIIAVIAYFIYQATKKKELRIFLNPLKINPNRLKKA